MSDQGAARGQPPGEAFALKGQGSPRQLSESLQGDQRRELESLLEEHAVERMLLELEIQARSRECEQARQELQRLQAEMERRILDRTTELEKACEDMKKLDEIKDSFLISVSHELRTPLTSIRSFSEILLGYEDLERDQQREFLGIINLESERLSRLINDVLDLSRIQAGGMPWNDDLLSLSETIQETVRAHAPLAREKSLEVSVLLPEELPLVFADRDRIQQIVTNLLGNAIKFSPPGGGIRIQAETLKTRRAEASPEWILVRVSDQGIGIDQQDQEVIFEKFRQVSTDTLKDKPQGTGLGLPICREILNHYKGNLWVESEKAKGSNFFFTLPAAPTSARRLCDTFSSEGGAGNRKFKTVLVVDDNRSVRGLLRYQLERRGYTVLEAANGQEALEVAKRAHVDLITLDLMMPVMSGYDLLEVIRDDPVTSSIPVLIVSVLEDQGKGILPGANDFLNKPFRESDLIGKVRTLLGQGQKTILVVDDERAVAETLRMQLEEKGYPVDVASNGEEAIDFMRTRVPDLLILDLLMPRKNGYEVLSWVRKEESTREVPVIVLSGCPVSGGGRDLFNLGADSVVEKSMDLSSLFDKIDTILTPPRPVTPRTGLDSEIPAGRLS